MLEYIQKKKKKTIIGGICGSHNKLQQLKSTKTFLNNLNKIVIFI